MQINAGDTAWVLTSAALVLFMTPGLALFYGGMVRAKNVLAMLMQNFFCMGIVSVLWALCVLLARVRRDRQVASATSTSRASTDVDHDAGDRASASDDPAAVVLAFQMMFAVITPGADHRRDRRPHAVLGVGRGSSALWSLLVYTPVAHWVFSPAGWLFERGALDFAGGTVVHINAGIAALARGARARQAARAGRKHPMPPHSLPLTLLGTGILWFGWFGFNAGSALGRQRRRRAGVHQHASSRPRPRCSAGCSSSGSSTGTPRRSAPRRARSPGWSRSRRAPASSAAWRRSPSACIAGAICFLAVS